MSDSETFEFGPYRLAVGFLATVPLFAAYELGLLDSASRNTAELLAGRVFELFGPHATLARVLTLLFFAALALVYALGDRDEDDDSLAHVCARQLGEGMLAALVLGPLLVLALSFFDVSVEALTPDGAHGGPAPPLGLSARVVGGAAWEELLFRLGVYGVLFLITVRLAHFFGLGVRNASPAGDLVALLGSSVIFAAFHLDVVTRLFGVGGEDFDQGLFLWRLLAGLSLGALFRWRGLAVAAWAHGLFNGALLLGAGPGVFAAA